MSATVSSQWSSTTRSTLHLVRATIQDYHLFQKIFSFMQTADEILQRWNYYKTSCEMELEKHLLSNKDHNISHRNQ